MKNSQKGFIAPLLIVIVAVLVIGGGAYFYSQKNNPPADISTPKNISVSKSIEVNTSKASAVKNSDGSYLFDFQGTITQNNQKVTYWFEYGATDSFGSKTKVQTSESDSVPSLSVDSQEMFQNLNGAIKPNTTYYYRLSAQTNSGSVVYGQTLQFKTATNTASPVSTTKSNQALSLISPNGGETISIGKPFTIKWKSSSSKQILITITDYLPAHTKASSGLQCQGVCGLSTTGIFASDGSYVWIPKNLEPGNKYKISLYIPGGESAKSVDYFTITN